MELKSQSTIEDYPRCMSSNRTFMELKLMQEEYWRGIAKVLIAPLWN